MINLPTRLELDIAEASNLAEKDSTLTPGQASAAGATLIIDHPAGGRRYMAHTFDLADGGIAWVDSGWTELMVSSHVRHYLKGIVKPTDRGWVIKTPKGDHVPVEALIRHTQLEGDREIARRDIQQDFHKLLLDAV